MNEGELMAHCVQRTCSRALQSNCNSHLVPSTRRVLAIDMVSFLHMSPPHPSAPPDSSLTSCVSPPSTSSLVGLSLSSLAACQQHILFHTICSLHMAKEHHLLVCCPLSQRL